MSAPVNPVIGSWYKDGDGEIFEIVAIDEEDNFIQIQYFGGEIDEIDFDAWESMEAKSVAEPEDWSGPYDDLEADDLGYTDMGFRSDQGFNVEDLD